MLWEQIKKIMSVVKGPCVIIERNEAKYVILPYEEYEKLVLKKKISSNLLSFQDEDSEQLRKANQEIAAMKDAERVRRLEKEFEDLSSEVQIEDLPIE